MRESLLSYLDDFASRGSDTAFAYRRGLRTYRWSYSRVAQSAFRFACELDSRGITKGERVLICGENCAEWVVAFYGCLLRGAVVVPLDVQSELDFVKRVQKQVQARLAVCDSNVRCEDLNIPVINLKELTSLIARYSDSSHEGVELTADDLVEIVFTSGTTTEPKGVCISHRNILANLNPLEHEILKYLKWERLVHPIRFLNALPLSHIFGQFMAIFVPPLLGGEVFFQKSLSPSEVIGTIRRERISVLVTVPRVLDSLREKIEADYRSRNRLDQFQRLLSSAEGRNAAKRWWVFRDVHRELGLKFWAVISGGATLSRDTEEFWHGLGFAVIQGYGMTETASLISVNHPFKLSRGSIGRVLPGRDVKVTENGEILVRGENVAASYWAAGGLRAEDGWFRTGDIGEMDQSGNLYFKGRKKEVIVTAAGMNVYPEDLELALNRQPEVRESAVIPAESVAGPEPLAVLILRDEKTDAARVVRRANAMLGQHQQILRWFVWPENDFPRTATQKIRKQVLVKRIREITLAESTLGIHRTALTQVVARVGGQAPESLDQSASLTTDLKLDSLGRVELLSALEDQYKIEIDEEAITSATTLGDIEKIVTEGVAEASFQYSYPRWTQRFPTTWFRMVFYYLVILPITRVMCWVRVIGKENLRDVQGPALFISNHVTMADHGLILSALPGRFRRSMAIAMDGEILREWLQPPNDIGWFTRLRMLLQYFLVVAVFNVFPLPRKSGFRKSFAFAGETVDHGYSVLVFPEGRRATSEKMGRFMMGTGLLAANLHLPVVPVRIDGLYELKERQQYFSKPGTITVLIGRQVRYSLDDDPQRVTEDLQKRVAEL